MLYPGYPVPWGIPDDSVDLCAVFIIRRGICLTEPTSRDPLRDRHLNPEHRSVLLLPELTTLLPSFSGHWDQGRDDERNGEFCVHQV